MTFSNRHTSWPSNHPSDTCGSNFCRTSPARVDNSSSRARSFIHVRSPTQTILSIIFDFKFYVVTGSRSDCFHGESRLRVIILILFLWFRSMRKVIGRGYGAHGFSSVLCILRLLDKSSLMMIVLAIYNRFRQGYTIPSPACR